MGGSLKNISLNSIKSELKTGDEILSFDGNNIGYSLSDFWKWSIIVL